MADNHTMYDQLGKDPGKYAVACATELATRADRLQVSPELKQLRELLDAAAGTAIYATAAKSLLVQPLLRQKIPINIKDWRSCGVQLYALWQGITAVETEARMAALREKYQGTWRKTFPDDLDIDAQKLSALYKSSPALLSNNVHDWNDVSLALRYYVAEQLAGVAGKAGVFDWGGGDGITCLFARHCGATDVHLFESNDGGRQFGQWLATTLGQDAIHFHEGDPTRPPEGRRFGAGICTEVLEHVIDPPAMVRFMYDLLLPGGVLFVTSSFAVPQDTHLKQNLQYAGKEQQIMTDAGFEPCRPGERLPMPFLPTWGFWRRPAD